MILELKTGRKRNGGLKRIKHTRNSTIIRSPQKNEPPMRGSLALPEFVLPKPKLPRFGAMILELKTGRKRNGGLKRIKHTRKSPLSRSNSFLAQKHSPNHYALNPASYASFSAGEPLISPACHTPRPIITPLRLGLSRQSRNPFSDDTTLSIFSRSESAAVIMK